MKVLHYQHQRHLQPVVLTRPASLEYHFLQPTLPKHPLHHLTVIRMGQTERVCGAAVAEHLVSQEQGAEAQK